MNWIEISALTAIASLIIGVFTTVIVWFMRRIVPTWGNTRTFLKNCVGIPENMVTGQAHVPGIFERLKAQDDVLAGQNEILHNIAEKVDQAANSNVTDTLRDDVDAVIKKVDALHKKVDALGNNTTVNVTQRSI